MTTSSLPTSPLDAATTVSQAAQAGLTASSQRPEGKPLTAALLVLEKSTKQTRLTIPAEALVGRWRLCFSAGKKAKLQSGEPLGNGFYIPQWAIAHLTFAAHDPAPGCLTITNELRLGPLYIRFTGPARYPGRKNLLAFDFTQLTVQGFGLTLYQGPIRNAKRSGQPFTDIPISQLPFFAFFTATETYIAARGRGGGLALWVKSQPADS